MVVDSSTVADGSLEAPSDGPPGTTPDSSAGERADGPTRTDATPGRLARWLVVVAVVAGTAIAVVALGAGGVAAQDGGNSSGEIDYGTDAQFSLSTMELGLLPYGTDRPVVEVGDDFGVATSVTNDGTEAGTRYVVFVPQVDCENYADDRLPMVQRAVELEPGESQSVTFYCDVAPDAEPTTSDPVVGVMNEEGQVDALRPSDVYDWDETAYPNGFEVVERQSPPALDVVGVDVPSSPTVGETATVSVGVNNTGGPGNVSTSLLVDGTEVDSVGGELTRHEQAAVNLTFQPGPGDWGERNLTVQTGAESVSGTVQVAPVPFDVEVVDAPDGAAPGGPLNLTVGVGNAGNASDVQPVGLTVAGTTVDTAEVALQPGASTTVTLSGSVPADATGSVNVTAVGLRDSQAGSVEVTTGAAGLDVAVAEVPDPVLPAAETLTADVEVSAPSGAAAGEVALSVDGQEVDATSVDLAAGENTTVTLSGAVDPTAGDSVTVTAASDSDTDERSVAVAEPLAVSIGDAFAPAPHGEDGRYRDTNGDGTVTQTDVTTFFRYQHRSAVTDNAAFFDYNGNGSVGLDDVVALFQAA